MGLPDLQAVFIHDVLVRLSILGDVCHVPPQGCEEWLYEFFASVGFSVQCGLKCFDFAQVPSYEILNYLRGGHAMLTFVVSGHGSSSKSNGIPPALPEAGDRA
jgi:hypothetical protein